MKQRDNTASEESEWELPLRGMTDGSESNTDLFQFSLRPTRLREYIGQESTKENLALAINAAKRRGEPLDHVLLHGPPGLGKTTLAAIIANELGVQFKATSGPVLERPGDLAAVLSSLGKGDVLFIDEIHRLHRTVEEILYPAMEDYQIDVLIGQGAAARSVKLSLQPFTLVGATTRTGMISAPLRDRFGIIERLEFYSAAQLGLIIDRSAALLGTPIEEAGLRELAGRSRGTPRIANRLLKRTRDVAQELADSVITGDVAALSLERLDIDPLGLDRMDRTVLKTIIEKFDGGPVGIETLAAALHEDRDTIEDVYEPFLMQQGFLQRTPRGRETTARAYAHLGYAHRHHPSSPDLFSYRSVSDERED